MEQGNPLRVGVVGAAACSQILGYCMRLCSTRFICDVGGQNTIHLRLFKIATRFGLPELSKDRQKLFLVSYRR